MKKGKNIMTITIGLICFILTCVIFIQFKTVEQTNITEIENMREAQLREKIATWREKYEETNIKYEETINKLNEYKEKRESNQEASELLDKELLQAKTIAGLTNVKGAGIIVTLADKENEEEGRVVEANDLNTLISELKLAGAEAISINDERITNMVDIFQVDPYTIVIDGKKKWITSPYVVKAIGDPKYLESALLTKNIGFVDQHPEIKVEISRQNNIKILKYSNDIKINYSENKEE